MSKTPISILQETMARQKCVPNYDIVLCKTGTHDNTFTYRVQCKDLIAEGTANNKKQAKHNAAAAMLNLMNVKFDNSCNPETSSILQLPKASNLESLERSSLNKTQTLSQKITEDYINYVGKLQELCIQNNYPAPVYGEPVMRGLPHMPEFEIKCTVSSTEEAASADSKKVAKQLAAQKVYCQLLKKIEEDDKLLSIPDISSMFKKFSIESDRYSSTERAIAKFKHINKVFTPVKPGFPANYHLEFKSAYYKKVNTKQLEDIKKSILTAYLNEVEIWKFLQNIQSLFSFTIEEVTLSTKCDQFMIALRIIRQPMLTTIGVGKTLHQAKVMAAKQLIENIILMLA